MRRTLPCQMLVLLTACLALAAADARAQDFAGTYAFSPDRPRHMTTVVVVRNERKLRPLFLTGRGEGQFEFNTRQPDRSRGEFALIGSRYSAARADNERMAGTAWLTEEERPPLALVVDRLGQWRQDPDHETRATARLEGAIRVGRYSVDVRGPVEVTFHAHGKVQGHDTPRRMNLHTRFEVEGRELGLTGDDAGPITIEFRGAGYTQPD